MSDASAAAETDWAALAEDLEDQVARTDNVRKLQSALYRLAQARSMLGEVEGGLWALDTAITFGQADALSARTDERLAALRQDARFEALVARMDLSARHTATDAFSTAYTPELTASDRAAGVSLVWSVVRKDFAWFERVPLVDWDARYREVLAEVLAEPSTEAYYRTLARWMAELRDGHTDTWLPDPLAEELSARPPLETVRLDGRTYVRQVFGDVPLSAGDEIVAIDGVAVDIWVAQNVAPFVSASTLKDFEHRAYGRRLLMGRPGPLNLSVVHRGREQEVTVLRVAGLAPPASEPVRWSAARGIGVLTIDTFATGRVTRSVDALWPEIERQQALILDLRRNGGGVSTVGWEVLSWLTDGEIPIGCWSVRTAFGPDAAWGTGLTYTVPSCNPLPDDAQGRHFSGPVAVLVGPGTYSAAEDTLLSFVALERGPLIGSASGGSSGQPVWYELPGGGGFRVCAKRDLLDKSGRTFVGSGFPPDIAVSFTPEDLRKGRDPVLDRAREVLAAQLRQP